MAICSICSRTRESWWIWVWLTCAQNVKWRWQVIGTVCGHVSILKRTGVKLPVNWTLFLMSSLTLNLSICYSVYSVLILKAACLCVEGHNGNIGVFFKILYYVLFPHNTLLLIKYGKQVRQRISCKSYCTNQNQASNYRHFSWDQIHSTLNISLTPADKFNCFASVYRNDLECVWG